MSVMRLNAHELSTAQTTAITAKTMTKTGRRILSIGISFRWIAGSQAAYHRRRAGCVMLDRYDKNRDQYGQGRSRLGAESRPFNQGHHPAGRLHFERPRPSGDAVLFEHAGMRHEERDHVGE